MSKPFHGRTYLYPTPAAGEQTIGVCEVMGSMWAVCWIATNTTRKRIKTHHLPVLPNPVFLQQLLDQWAALRKLEEVK